MSDTDKPQVVVVHHDIHVHEVSPRRKQVTQVEEPPKKWCWTRLQEACQRNKDNKCSYKCWSEMIQILCDSCGVCVLFVFENLLGIVFLILGLNRSITELQLKLFALLGIVFFNDCPIDQSIPISLLVVGMVSLIHAIVVQFIRWKWIDIKDKKDGFATSAQVVLVITSIVYMVAFIWGIPLRSVSLNSITLLFLCSAAFSVFHISDRVKTHTEDKSSELYCNGFLYWFTFWFFIFLAILGAILLVFICLIFCIVLSGAAVESPQPQLVVVHRHQPTSPSAAHQTSDQKIAGQQKPAMNPPPVSQPALAGTPQASPSPAGGAPPTGPSAVGSPQAAPQPSANQQNNPPIAGK